MNRGPNLYQYIYNDLAGQIFTGILSRGDKLPSEGQLCTNYSVGRNTVRKALSLLQEDGFIKIVTGKKPVVAYGGQGLQQRHLQRLQGRSKAVCDAYEAICVLFPEFVVQSNAAQGAAFLAQCRRRAAKINPWEQSAKERSGLLLRLLQDNIAQLKNPLLSDLFITLIHFVSVPYINRPGVKNPHLCHPFLSADWLNRTFEQRQLTSIYNETAALCREALANIGDYFASLPGKAPEGTGEAGFLWLPARGSSHMYTQVAADLLGRLQAAGFRPGEELPGVRALEKEYDVSAATIKNTYALLNALGAVQAVPVAGRVRQVNRPGELDVGDPGVRKLLAGYCQALHIKAMTVGRVAAQYADGIPRPALKELRARCLARAPHPYHRLYALLSAAVPIQALRTIYAELGNLSVWGYVLTPAFQEGELAPYYQRLPSLLDSLEAGRALPFARGLEETYLNYWGLVKEKLLAAGITEVRDIPAPRPSPCAAPAGIANKKEPGGWQN